MSADVDDQAAERSPTCPECGDTFASYRGRRVHQASCDGASDATDPDDGVACPTCDEVFKNEHGVSVHHARAHGEPLGDPETSICEHCGDEYEVGPGSKGKYCSRECFHATP